VLPGYNPQFLSPSRGRGEGVEEAFPAGAIVKGKPFQGNLKIHGKALKKSLEMVLNLC
jgi:hypothetical protein